MEDLPILLEFEQGVINAEKPFDITLKEKPVYYDIPELINAPYIEMAVAQAGDKIIGSGYARIEIAKHYLRHESHGYLGFMYVVPAYRGKGVNKKIINALENWAAKKNITELRLDVYNMNEPAISAYEKVGFIKHMINMRKGIGD